MKITNRKTLIASAIALTFGFSAVAMAEPQTVSDSFDVTANVIGVCSLTAGNTLAFGDYNPVTGDTVDGTTSISVTCSNGMGGAEVGLDHGGVMAGDPGGSLTYQLFQDSGRTLDWGIIRGGEEENVRPVDTNGEAQVLDVYGRINGAQYTAPVGAYTATVNAIVYF
jgi:spore coat protein U-like protein